MRKVAFCFLVSRPLQKFIDCRVDSLVPQAEVLESVRIIQVCNVIYVDEAVDGAQFDQSLLADHFNLKHGWIRVVSFCMVTDRIIGRVYVNNHIESQQLRF